MARASRCSSSASEGPAWCIRWLCRRVPDPCVAPGRVFSATHRGSGGRRRCRCRVEGDGRREPECHRVHRTGAHRRVRPEQGDRRTDGDGQRDEHRRVHAHSSTSRSPTPRRPSSPAPPARRIRRSCPVCRPSRRGRFNQTITAGQADASWAQALNVWTTPWGFLKGAAANTATVRRQGGQQIVSFSPAASRRRPAQPYTVTGFIEPSESRHQGRDSRRSCTSSAICSVEFEYSAYQNMGGVQVPTRVVQRQAGMPTFEATSTVGYSESGERSPSYWRRPRRRGARRRRGGAPSDQPRRPSNASATACSRSAETTSSLAIDMGDHVLVVESGQSDARGLAVMAAAKQAIPDKPVRFVVNSHPHFDHAGGLAAAVAEGVTILTHRNNEPVLERLLSGPRTLSATACRRFRIAVPTSLRRSATATCGRGPTARSSNCITSRTSTATACSPSFSRPRRCCGRLTSRS